MNFDDAIKRAQEWELEDENENPLQGSEDEPNVAAALTQVNHHVVYSRLTQGQILSEVWDEWRLILAVEKTIRDAAQKEVNPSTLWIANRPMDPCEVTE